MVDRELILRRLASLDTYLEQLAPYRAIDVSAYRQDWKTQRIVERTLHLAIETCMDVADPRPLGSALASMVGFRNILVHDYTRLDLAIVVRVLRTDLVDVERFRDAMRALV
jgi:uncharacterized protein YutE (UPF0331/DUF86 family)